MLYVSGLSPDKWLFQTVPLLDVDKVNALRNIDELVESVYASFNAFVPGKLNDTFQLYRNVWSRLYSSMVATPTSNIIYPKVDDATKVSR